MEIKKEDYAARVANSSPIGLTLINFELIENNLSEALNAHAAGDKNAFEARMESAREFLNLMMASLDMTYAISGELMRIYIYVNGLINGAVFHDTKKNIAKARDMLGKIAESFKSVAGAGDAAETEAVMQNAERVYAGLTYKDGKLSEYVDADAERGYKA